MNGNPKIVLNPQLFPLKSRQAKVDMPPAPQLSLYDVRQQTDGLRARYQSNELEYKALTLAYEALRLAWMGECGNRSWLEGQLRIIDTSTQCIAEHLLPPALAVPDEPVPVSLPEWLQVA